MQDNTENRKCKKCRNNEVRNYFDGLSAQQRAQIDQYGDRKETARELIRHHTHGGIDNPQIHISADFVNDHEQTRKKAQYSESDISKIDPSQQPARYGEKEYAEEAYQQEHQTGRQYFKKEIEIQSVGITRHNVKTVGEALCIKLIGILYHQREPIVAFILGLYLNIFCHDIVAGRVDHFFSHVAGAFFHISGASPVLIQDLTAAVIERVPHVFGYYIHRRGVVGFDLFGEISLEYSLVKMLVYRLCVIYGLPFTAVKRVFAFEHGG